MLVRTSTPGGRAELSEARASITGMAAPKAKDTAAQRRQRAIELDDQR